MKARPLQFTLSLPHHLLPALQGKQNPSNTLNPDKSLQISEIPTWVLDYALPPWKNPSLPCKHTLWWSSSAILTMSRPWRTKLMTSLLKSLNLKSNYSSTKPPRRYNAPPTCHLHHYRPGPKELPEHPQANPLPTSKTKSLPLLFSPNATVP